jgi:hypothetical protein
MSYMRPKVSLCELSIRGRAAGCGRLQRTIDRADNSAATTQARATKGQRVHTDMLYHALASGHLLVLSN